MNILKVMSFPAGCSKNPEQSLLLLKSTVIISNNHLHLDSTSVQKRLSLISSYLISTMKKGIINLIF